MTNKFKIGDIVAFNFDEPYSWNNHIAEIMDIGDNGYYVKYLTTPPSIFQNQTKPINSITTNTIEEKNLRKAIICPEYLKQ